MPHLLHREMVFVTGKGGAGKTTVALATALAASRAGRRTILCETGGQRRAAALLGRRSTALGTEVQIAERLWTISIDPRRALEEWAARQIGSRRLVGVLSRSNAFGAFVNAAPGARELLTITKAWELGRAERWDRRARGYDLVIVDGPASGHGLGMLRTPKTFRDIARVGPIASQSSRVADLLSDGSRSAVLAVALPEETPVTETLELERRVHGELGRGLDAIVVNGVLPRRFTAAEMGALGAADGAVPAAAAAAARRQHGQSTAQQGQVRRLRQAARAAVLTLPFVPRDGLRFDDVSAIASDLAHRLALSA
jgi:anion-transporting  ArsA/GET3 family ATPase